MFVDNNYNIYIISIIPTVILFFFNKVENAEKFFIKVVQFILFYSGLVWIKNSIAALINECSQEKIKSDMILAPNWYITKYINDENLLQARRFYNSRFCSDKNKTFLLLKWGDKIKKDKSPVDIFS